MFEAIRAKERRIRNYRVLSEDNLEDISRLTGKTKKDLEEMLTKCNNFGWVEVFWQDRNRWFNVRVDGQYVYAGLLDRVVEELMGRVSYD